MQRQTPCMSTGTDDRDGLMLDRLHSKALAQRRRRVQHERVRTVMKNPLRQTDTCFAVSVEIYYTSCSLQFKGLQIRGRARHGPPFLFEVCSLSMQGRSEQIHPSFSTSWTRSQTIAPYSKSACEAENARVASQYPLES